MTRSPRLGAFAALLPAVCPLALLMPSEGCSSQERSHVPRPELGTVDPTEAQVVFELAREHARAGDESAALEALQRSLAGDPLACQHALLEPAFERSGLRDEPDFREALARSAAKHGVSELTLAPDDEPGEWIEIDGLVVDGEGHAVAGALVELFATDREGRYHPDHDDVARAERTPRLFAALVSDSGGRFRFKTVRPGPYPGTANARHVHVRARQGDRRLAAPGYVVFDDDPLLAEPQNAEQRGEALRIHMRTGDGMGAGTFERPFLGVLELPLD